VCFLRIVVSRWAKKEKPSVTAPAAPWHFAEAGVSVVNYFIYDVLLYL
jgi:hypothetical protein